MYLIVVWTQQSVYNELLHGGCVSGECHYQLWCCKDALFLYWWCGPKLSHYGTLSPIVLFIMRNKQVGICPDFLMQTVLWFNVACFYGGEKVGHLNKFCFVHAGRLHHHLCTIECHIIGQGGRLWAVFFSSYLASSSLPSRQHLTAAQHQLPTVWHFALGTNLPFFSTL